MNSLLTLELARARSAELERAAAHRAARDDSPADSPTRRRRLRWRRGRALRPQPRPA